jgi:hypothetical protein
MRIPRSTGRANVRSLALEVSILLGQIPSRQDMALVKVFPERGNKDGVHRSRYCWSLEPLH